MRPRSVHNVFFPSFPVKAHISLVSLRGRRRKEGKTFGEKNDPSKMGSNGGW
jgi:hypothetical protein